MVDDNKELVEKLEMALGASKYSKGYMRMKSYKTDALPEIRKFAQAALAIIQPELDKRDEALDKAYNIDLSLPSWAAPNMQYCPWCRADEKVGHFAHCSRKQYTALKTTTGHDNNTEKRGKR